MDDTQCCNPGAIVVEGDGKVHVGWTGELTWIRHAVDDGAGFEIEDVVQAGGSAMAVDADGVIHFALVQRLGAAALQYVSNATGDWEWEIMAGNPVVGATPTIVAADDGIHLAYPRGLSNAVEVATDASGAWATEPVGETTNVGVFLAIAQDGTAHVTFMDPETFHVMHAAKRGDEWVVDDIAAEFGSAYSVLAVAPDGSAHMAWTGWNTGHLNYATDVTGEWVVETIADEGLASNFAAIAVDSEGHPFVSYTETHGVWDGTLRLMTNASGEWVGRDVEGTGNAWYSAIAIGPDDDVHIAYGDRADVLHVNISAADGVDQDCDGEAW